MKHSVRLDIPDALPSLNKLLRMHWSERRKLRGQWQWALKAEVLNRHLAVKLIPKAKVTIERFSRRKIDFDNLVGANKILVDSLVREGFLVDDSPDHVTVNYIQHIGEPHTTISLEAA